MEEELISKKDLLSEADISYGQLYRWKRKGLIPESWFIRKATFTGQETFFPRERVLARVEKIKSMKEETNLDELAGVFSPAPSGVALTYEEVAGCGLFEPAVLEQFARIAPQPARYEFTDLLFLSVFARSLGSGALSLDECAAMHALLVREYTAFAEAGCVLTGARKLGVFFCFLHRHDDPVAFDAGVQPVFTCALAALAEELKLKLFA